MIRIRNTCSSVCIRGRLHNTLILQLKTDGFHINTVRNVDPVEEIQIPEIRKVLYILVAGPFAQ